MTERAALVAAVLAHPADDAPRLILADWLDEHGQSERAEFIRGHVRLARRALAGWFDDEAASLVVRLDELADAWLERWTADLPGAWLGRVGVSFRRQFPEGPAHFAVHRGFVAELVCPSEVWGRLGPGLVRAEPIVRVTFPDRRPGTTDGARALAPWDGCRWYRARTPAQVWHRDGVVREEWWAWLGGRQVGTDGRALTYRTEGEALDALSGAALAWARAARLKKESREAGR